MLFQVPDPEFDAYTIRDAESNSSGPAGVAQGADFRSGVEAKQIWPVD